MASQEISQKYAQFFQSTFMASNTEERKQAELQLEQASTEDSNFLLNVINIIIMEQTQPQIKQSASIYVNHYLRANINPESPNNIQIKQNCEILLQALISPQILIRYKSPINSALSIILQFEQNQEIWDAIFANIAEYFQKEDINGLAGTFLIFQSMLNSTSHAKKIQKLYQQYIGLLTASAFKLLMPVNQILAQQALNNNKLPQDQFKMVVELQFYIPINLFRRLNILVQWSNTMQILVQKLSDKQIVELRVVMGQFLQNEQVFQLITTILCLICQNQNQVKDCIVSCSGEEEIDSGLNELKTNVLKFYNRCNVFMFEEKNKLDLTKSPFLLLSQQILLVVLNSTIKFCTQASYQKMYDQLNEKANEQLIVECLAFICKYGQQAELFQVFSQYKNVLFTEVIFPLLKTTSQELELFQNNPQEYVNLALDTCDKQVKNKHNVLFQLSETFKTQAAQLLEILCDHIDGTISYIAHLSIHIILYSISSDDLSQIDVKFPFLKDLQQKYIFNNDIFSAEQRVEVCFVILSIMSYLFPKRKDLVQLVEGIIRDNSIHFFQSQLPPLLKSRFTLFLGYFADTLFLENDDKDYYHSCIEFLVQAAMIKDESQNAIVFQAIDSLTNIYDDEDLSIKLSGTVILVFKTLIQNITYSTYTQFLDLIQTICKSYSKIISEDQNVIIVCVQLLVERITKEFQQQQEGSKRSQLFINKCWNIMRTISENNDYIPQYISQIEVKLNPLLEGLSRPEKIEFEDDILLTLTSFMKRSKNINQSSCYALQFTPKLFEKYHGVFGHLLQYLNYILVYGQQYFPSNLGSLGMIIELSLQALFTKNDKSNEADNAEGAAILQLVIQNYYKILTPDSWILIFSKAMERLQKPITHDFLKGRLLGIFISGFLVNFQYVQNVLKEMGLLSRIIEMTVLKVEYYQATYDAKLFIIGMSTILLNDQLGQEFIQKLGQIMDYIVTLLRNLEQKENKKQSTNKLSNEFDSDDNYEDDIDDKDDENYQGDDYVIQIKTFFQFQDKITLQDFINYLIEQDEFDYFRKILTCIKERSENVFKNLVNTLPQEKLNYLKQVVQVHRITLDTQDKKTLPRKIVKVKKQ